MNNTDSNWSVFKFVFSLQARMCCHAFTSWIPCVYLEDICCLQACLVPWDSLGLQVLFPIEHLRSLPYGSCLLIEDLLGKGSQSSLPLDPTSLSQVCLDLTPKSILSQTLTIFPFLIPALAAWFLSSGDVFFYLILTISDKINWLII